MSAFIPPVNGEIDTSDNSYNAGWICVSILGDVTGPKGLPDRKVDMRDIGAVARIFGAKYPILNPIQIMTLTTTAKST